MKSFEDAYYEARMMEMDQTQLARHYWHRQMLGMIDFAYSKHILMPNPHHTLHAINSLARFVESIGVNWDADAAHDVEDSLNCICDDIAEKLNLW